MAPIRKGDGTALDPQGVTEVRTGDGRVLWTLSALDSEIHQYDPSNFTTSNWPDGISNSDIDTINGLSFDSNSFEGSGGVEGDGSDYGQSDTMGSFGSSMDTDFAVSIPFQTSAGEDNDFFGIQNTGDSTQFRVAANGFSFDDPLTNISMLLVDDSGDQLRINTDSDYADGDPHHLIINKTGQAGGDFNVYVDDMSTPAPTTVVQDDGLGTFSDFNVPMTYFAHNAQGTIEEHYAGDIGKLSWLDGSLTESGRQTVQDNLGWSPGNSHSLNSTAITGTAADGGQLADLTDSDSLDVVAAGIDGSAYWYDNGNSWQEHSIANGFSAPEGIDAADYDGDGDVEVILLDQGSGDVAVIDQDNSDPTGSWTSTIIDSNAPNVQHSLSADLTGNGNPDLIYTYEGTTSGEGGVFWLEHTGGSVTDAANWTKHTIAQEEGAWGLARQRVDLSGDGNATDIVFGARDLNNDSASGGLWWAEQPSGPTGSWSVTAIDTSIVPLNVDVGDFSGDGNPTDVVVGLYDTGTGVYWYDANDWSQNTITPSDDIWNVRGWNPGSGAWNVLVDDVATDTLTYYVNDGSGGFAADATASMYKADDRWPRGDVDGDGSDTEFIATSENAGIDLWEVSG